MAAAERLHLLQDPPVAGADAGGTGWWGEMKSLRATLLAVFAAWHLLVLTSCHAPLETGPTPTEGFQEAHEMVLPVAPPIYAQWWREVEQCSERKAPFAMVTWKVVSSPLFIIPGYQSLYLGVYIDPFIILGLFSTSDAKVVRHEILHAILSRNGVRGDDQRPFFEQCKDVVRPY